MTKNKTSSIQILKIQDLRSKGYSIPEISQGLDMPKTTVFKYVQNIAILPQFIKEWEIKRGGSKKRQLIKEEKAFFEAKKLIGKLSNKEKILFISALYWAEGNKKDFMLSNTDPDLIGVFINVLREVFDIEDDRFRISIRIYEDMNKQKCLNFWSKVVGIPKKSFQNVSILYGKKKGKLEYGMCRVRITKGGDLLKKIKAINKNFSKQLANSI